ncbi:MAG TPA: hypothetical protein VFD77_00315 [Brumimicrobium sp.]|nr:hypothetical protein [Brumimicrobium sp.]
MRSLALLIGSIFLFFSCQNEEEQKNLNEVNNKENQESVDGLPEGKWNGEYMKIDDDDEPKIKKKSLGSEFFSMGSLKLKIGDDSVDFNLFERQKNILTFTNGSITAFIKSAFNEDVHLYFKKNDIVIHHKGKYKADPSGKANNSVKMTIKSGEVIQQKEYTLESGEVEILHFSPRLGTLEAKINGMFSSKNGKKQKGEGTIKINFEGAIMTAE